MRVTPTNPKAVPIGLSCLDSPVFGETEPANFTKRLSAILAKTLNPL
jgi:hypothetical protein